MIIERFCANLLQLAFPVLAEHLLHILVGINDTYLANHLPSHAPEATAAVGTIAFIFWFLGMFAGAIGTGSTAIIAREVGARTAAAPTAPAGSPCCSQRCSESASVRSCFSAAVRWLISAAWQASRRTDTFNYLRMLTPAAPFMIVMFVANSCLRGAGDTLTPAISMIVVDIVNIFFTWGFTRGLFGMPNMGFNGIAVGTVIAYIAGGVLQVIVLLIGRGGIRLHLHRLRPHWNDLRRILRIGIPGGVTDLLYWIANFALLTIVNRTKPVNIAAAAHTNAIRIESFSYMTGFAVSIAVATMVGQSLGMKNPRRAERAAYLGYFIGGGFMTLMGILLIFFAQYPTRILAEDPQVRELTAACLRITGFCQISFAAAIIFGGALRGAGDTMAVLILTMVSILCFRVGGVVIVGGILHKPLPYIWVILATDLFVRGILVYGRFLHGGWKRIRV